jgi:SAM-dependent methyltransferase
MSRLVMDDASVDRLLAAIAEVVRARALPAPRGLPYLGLEHASGTSLDLLHTLSTHGIFRKYELVLDVEAGLGASSRWMAQRLGCEVIGTAASTREAVAAADLARRARLAAHARCVAARSGALPFRPSRFTHVWMVETLPRLDDAGCALAEAARVLRHRGQLAIQDLVVGDEGARPTIPGWRFETTAARVAALRHLPFVEVQVHDRTAEAHERSAAVLAARERLLADLRRRDRRLASERVALGDALAAGTLRVVHILARRA